MRKFNFFLTALLALFTTTAHADRILYSENYEAGGVPTTWTNQKSRGTLEIVPDGEGHYLSWALGQNNGTGVTSFWGESIFDSVKEGLTEYSVKVDFQFGSFGNNQFNGEIAIYSGEGSASDSGQGTAFAGDNKGQWTSYSNLTPNCLFGIAQNSHGDGKDQAASDLDGTHWFINGDSTNIFTPTAGTWYTLTLTVNLSNREVAYVIEDLDGTFKKTGSKTMAEDANIYASGLFIMNARYQSITNVDNLTVTIPGEFANDPVIALTGILDTERTYTISFMEGETLYLTGTDNTEKIINYNDTDPAGSYVYKTTTSGTLKAYTKVGNIVSNIVEQEVNCVSIVLPAPASKIVAAKEGYGKTIQFTVDRSSIELSPEIFMDFSFKADNGTDDFILENQNNGAKVEIPSKGTLTITTKATGYTAYTSTFDNNVEYKLNTEKSINFAHLTEEQLTAIGYNADGLVTGNFANYGRLFCVSTSGDTLVYKEIPQYTKLSSTFEDGTFYPNLYYIGSADAGASFAEKNNTKVPVNVHIWQGVGLNFEGRQGDDMSGSWIKYAYFMVDNMVEGEFAAVYIGGNYGNSDADSNHPVVESLEEVKTTVNLIENRIDGYAAGEPIYLNRISDAIGRIDIYTPSKESAGIKDINKVVYTADAPIYNLNGVQVNAKSLKKGVYVKQGKKFVVR